MSQTKAGAIKVLAKKSGVTPEEYKSRRESGLKWCMRCVDWHEISEFGRDSTRYDGLDPSCRQSRNARQRELHVRVAIDKRKPNGPPRNEARSGDKIQARHFVNQNVLYGKIPNPNDVACFDCGHTGSDRRHEYDHFMGYSAEHHEVVQAVCTNCHAKRESARITHCLRGHEYTQENTGHNSNGGKFCKECRRARDRGRRDAAFWRAWRLKKKRINA